MTRRRRVKAGRKVVRSGYEASLVKQLDSLKAKYSYEKRKIKYVIPEREATYTPDFELKNGIIIEAKGKFTAADRKKMLLVTEQHPKLDIRMLFMRDQKLSKVSNTKYSEWCDKHGMKYAIGQVPQEWIDEK